MRRILSGPGRIFQSYLQNSEKRPQKKVYILCASLYYLGNFPEEFKITNSFQLPLQFKGYAMHQDVMFDLQGLHTALPEIACVVGNPF